MKKLKKIEARGSTVDEKNGINIDMSSSNSQLTYLSTKRILVITINWTRAETTEAVSEIVD